MLPYRVYLPQELEAMSSPGPNTVGDQRPSPMDDRSDNGPGTTTGLRVLAGAVARLVGRGRLRRPAPGTV